ncbi:MAG: hypothetical protein KDD38_10410 [Bdellovibrionales bacterium]|nr:hypothetical protein [Bdellovibrionales bacterium]
MKNIMIAVLLMAIYVPAQATPAQFVDKMSAIQEKGAGAVKAAPLIASLDVVAAKHLDITKQLITLLGDKNNITRILANKKRVGSNFKERYAFMGCIFMMSVGHLDNDFAERERNYSICASKSGVVLEPRDIEQIYSHIPRRKLDTLVLGQEPYKGSLVVFEELCLKNPLGPDAFTPSENAFYCKLNLGFRGCNLMSQKVNGLSRMAAFDRCKNNGSIALTKKQQDDYVVYLKTYLSQ